MGVRPISSKETSEKANQEALGWLIALQEDPDDEDVQARFDTWLKSGRGNQQAWAEAQHVWNVLGDAKNAPAMPTAAPKAGAGSRSNASPLQATSGSRGRSRPFVWAAAGVAAVCLTILFQPAINIWLRADYSTSTAQVRDIRLEDGSIVHLGADSAIEVSFEPAARRVRLLSGEAYFEVEPNPARPFQVEAKNVETTVLGTAFNVQMMSNGVAVAVNHGRVGVEAPQVQQGLEDPLGAGDWVRVDWGGHVERGNDEPELVGGWRRGMLVVKDRPIVEVVDEIRRHYSGTIVMPETELGRQRVTGVYDLRNPVEALRAVAQVHGANARRISPWMTVISSY